MVGGRVCVERGEGGGVRVVVGREGVKEKRRRRKEKQGSK
jgi:hypothetical protein